MELATGSAGDPPVAPAVDQPQAAPEVSPPAVDQPPAVDPQLPGPAAPVVPPPDGPPRRPPGGGMAPDVPARSRTPDRPGGRRP